MSRSSFYKELNKESKWFYSPLMKSMLVLGTAREKDRRGWYKY